jgi:osmoprotectant transport system substrate-binding protein
MDRRSFVAGLVLACTACTSRTREISVGSKNFTEQLLLGELLAQYLASVCRDPVEKRFYLAGTYICQQALLAGRIDTYVEYTGTALAAILKQNPSGDSQAVYLQVKNEYQRRFGLEVMPPLGFNNSFAMVMRGDDARRLGASTLSQLAPASTKMRLGVGYEFLERQDGYKGLVSTYDLKFGEAPRVMDLGLLYRALQNRSVDIVAGNNTDGLIAAFGLVVLEDDKHYFPPYDAVPIVRPELFQKCLQARAAFEQLGGRITADDMRAMNYAVDGEKKDAAEVAREFLEREKLMSFQQENSRSFDFVLARPAREAGRKS